MRIIDVIERSPFSLPVKDVLDENGGLSFLESIKSKNYFNVEFRSNTLTFVAGNYIGQIPLTGDIAINVKPKIPINNLARIISLGNQPVKCLNFFNRAYMVEGEVSNTLLEAIAQSLVSSLKILDAEGIYREYSVRDEHLPTLRGRINIPQFVRQNISKSMSRTLPCTFYELTADTLLNRLIKKAIFKIGEALSIQSTVAKELLSDLTYFANRLTNIKLDHKKHVEEEVRLYLQRNRLPVLRSYYLDIIDTCLLILDGSGVELVRTEGTTTLHSFLVNLENAFESYIREVLRQSAKLSKPVQRVLDGNNEGKSYLFSDSKKYDAKPDLVIGSREKVIAIGDVKYKTKLSEADRYQLISHAISYKSNLAFFVTPLMDKTEVDANYIGKIGDIKLYHYKVDLDSHNLFKIEEQFSEWVENLITGM